MKVHNSNAARKIRLREHIVDGLPTIRVLEMYAGPGSMRAAAWLGAAEVVGIDSDLRSVAEYHGDVVETIRHLDVSRFNVFDADAFAAPWEPVWLISRRCATLPDDIAIFTTRGGAVTSMSSTYKKAGWSRQMMDALGVTPEMPCSAHIGKRGASLAARSLFEGFFPCRTVTRFATSVGGASGGTLYAGARLVRSGG